MFESLQLLDRLVMIILSNMVHAHIVVGEHAPQMTSQRRLAGTRASTQADY
jgi:hypothetical protein